MLTRFFAGLFGSAPVTNTGGVLGDIWNPQQRGTAIVGYAFAVVGGPTIGVNASTWLLQGTILTFFSIAYCRRGDSFELSSVAMD